MLDNEPDDTWGLGCKRFLMINQKIPDDVWGWCQMRKCDKLRWYRVIGECLRMKKNVWES